MPSLSGFFSGDEVVLEEEAINAGTEEGFDGFGGGVDDGLAFDVETGVEDHLAAGFFADFLEEAVVGGIVGGGDGLDAGGAVDVGDGGERAAPLLADVDDGDHVGKVGAWFDAKPAINFLERDGGGEGAEGFALFDHGIDAVAHFGMAGVGEDAAVAEGARAEFHGTAVPSEDGTGGDEVGGGAAGFVEGGEGADFDLSGEGGEGLLDGLVVVGGAEEGDVHSAVGDGAIFGGEKKRGAEGGAIVAGGGLDVDVVEQAGAEEVTVGGAIEGDAASEGEMLVSGGSGEGAADMEEDGVEAFLKRGGEVAVLGGDFGAGRTGGDEVAVEVIAGGEVVLAFVAGFVEAQ